MDYEKKYKDALSRARSMYKSQDDAELAAYIFPELAESEDDALEFLKGQAIEWIASLEHDISQSIYDGVKGHSPEDERELERWKKALAWLEKQKESTWSEEEKDKLNSIERLIVNANAHGNYLIGDKEAIDLQHFIRSIVKPTTNLAEWSAEDEKMRNSILDKMISLDNAYGGDGIAYGSEIAWLKSLRPSWKPSEVCYGAKGDPDPAGVWKPSEKQIEALEYVIRDYREDSCNATANYLQEILDHLKNV